MIFSPSWKEVFNVQSWKVFLCCMSKDCSPGVWVVSVSLFLGLIDLLQGLKNAPEKLFSYNLVSSG